MTWRRRSGNLCSAMRDRGAYRDPVASCALAHGSRVFRPRAARLMATDGYWHCTVVAVGFGRRLAVQRETDAALHHSEARDVFWQLGPNHLRDGGQDPPTAALVWTTRSPQRKDSEQPIRRAPFISQGGLVRSIARFRHPSTPVRRPAALKVGGLCNMFRPVKRLEDRTEAAIGGRKLASPHPTNR
jgi:hypothetical protein